MTKLELEAIRALPEEYVRDGTQVMFVNECPVAINPALVARIYLAGEWRIVTLAEYGALPMATRVVFENMGPPVKPETVPLMQWAKL